MLKIKLPLSISFFLFPSLSLSSRKKNQWKPAVRDSIPPRPGFIGCINPQDHGVLLENNNCLVLIIFYASVPCWKQQHPGGFIFYYCFLLLYYPTRQKIQRQLIDCHSFLNMGGIRSHIFLHYYKLHWAHCTLLVPKETCNSWGCWILETVARQEVTQV